jgi:hypothetical protein
MGHFVAEEGSGSILDSGRPLAQVDLAYVTAGSTVEAENRKTRGLVFRTLSISPGHRFELTDGDPMDADDDFRDVRNRLPGLDRRGRRGCNRSEHRTDPGGASVAPPARERGDSCPIHAG